jgi:DNA-binding SARP family transcriptional activator
VRDRNLGRAGNVWYNRGTSMSVYAHMTMPRMREQSSPCGSACEAWKERNDAVRGMGASSAPFFRIWTCGTFLVERWDGASYQPVRVGEWGGSQDPRRLLKKLVCSPGRRARKGEVLEDLWAEVDPKEAGGYLNDAAYRLRAVLRPAKGMNSLLVTADDHSSYALPGQNDLWIDADAALALLEQAEAVEGTGADPLRLVEQAATYLARGAFLEEEEGLWVYGRCGTLERAQRGCVLWQAKLYEQHGWLRRAERVLCTLLEATPTDEDALCCVMTNLHQQQRTSEALRLYEGIRTLLAEDGLEPLEAISALANHLRNTAEPFAVQSREARLFPLAHDHMPVPLSGQAQVLAASVRTGKDDMDKKRRELLHLLSIAGAALVLPLLDVDWERTFGALARPSRLDSTVIEDLEAINSRYWSLYLTAASKSSVLHGVVGQLKTLVQFLQEPHPGSVHSRLCTLVSDLSQLAGEVFFDLHEHESAQACYMFAASAAKEAGAYDLWSCALVRHAFLPLYEASFTNQPERYEDTLSLLQAARRLAERGDSELPTRYWVAAVEAEATSGVHHFASCQDALGRAQGVLESKGTRPAWIRFDGSRLPALHGACYVRLQQPDVAMPALQEALQQFAKPDRKRGLVLLDLATAAVLRRDVEQACTYVEEAIDIVALGSSGFLREGIQQLRHQLEPFAGLAAVKEVDQHMRLLA